MEASIEEPLPGKCRDWIARLGPGVVVVDDWCTFPTAGYNVELRKAEPRGSNTDDLLLERIVTIPEGYQPPVIRGIEVDWEEQTDVEYKTATILPDGPTLDVIDQRG